jgi:phosphatidylglycerophosphate synthase
VMRKVESIKELREKLQSVKKKRGTTYWGHRLFIHIPCIYLTRVCLKLNISAHPITTSVLVFGILGGVFLFMEPFWAKIVGLILVYLNIMVDGSDGEVARYNQTTNEIRGIYIDDLNHLIVPPLFLISIGIGLLGVTRLPSNLLLLSAVIGGLSWSVMKARGKESYHLFSKHYIKNIEGSHIVPEPINKTEDHAIGTSVISTTNPLRRLLGLRFQIRQFLFAFLLFVIALIVDRLFMPQPEAYTLVSWLTIIYGVFLTLHLIEEIIKGFFQVEREIGHLASNYTITKRS